MSKRLILLALAAALPLSGCKKAAEIYHKYREKKHEERVEKAAAAAATPKPSTTPAPSAAPVTQQPAHQAINKSAGAIVLLYHRFEEKPRKGDQLAITPTEFEKEMGELKENGFTVIPMQDFLAWRRGEKDIPAKSCIITIDDGYLSGYETAWPILKKFGYPFTMFVYIDYIGSGGKSISWDQLAEMRDAGVDIESHTYSHSHLDSPGYGVDATTKARVQKDLQTLGREGWLHKEVADSKKVLEQNLGIKVDAFAYPFGTGYNNPHIRAVVKQAGYEAAFSVYGQRNGFTYPPFDQIGRYAVGGAEAPKVFDTAMKMVGGGGGGGESVPSQPSMMQLASASMITEPMEGATISNPTPTIKANLATMGAVDAGSVKMRISGIGPVPAKYDAVTKMVTYKVTAPLTEKSYSVILSAVVDGKSAETRWTFNFDPTAKAGPGAGADLTAPPKP